MRLLPLVAALVLTAAPAAADCRFTLHFAFGSARVELADRLLLQRLRATFPAGPFVLSAHADGEGTERENLAMARARAQAVGRHLGAAATSAIVAGEYWHAVPSDVSAPLNRRVELFTPDCPRASFPEARIVDTPGVMVEGGDVLLLPPLPLVLD